MRDVHELAATRRPGSRRQPAGRRARALACLAGPPLAPPLALALALALTLALAIPGCGEPEPQSPTPEGTADQQTVEALLGSVQAYIQAEEHQKAATVLERGVAAFPRDVDLRLALGQFRLTQLRFGDSFEAFNTAIALLDERGAPVDTATLVTAGSVAEAADRLDDADRLLTRAIGQDPMVPENRVLLGQVLMRAGEPARAATEFRAAAELDPARPIAWGGLAEASRALGRYDDALAAIAEARALDAHSSTWRVLEARVHISAGEPGRAIGLLMALPENERAVRSVAAALADAQAAAGDPAAAYRTLAEALWMASDDPGYLLRVAAAAEAAGETDAARRLVSQARRLDAPRVQRWEADRAEEGEGAEQAQRAEGGEGGEGAEGAAGER